MRQTFALVIILNELVSVRATDVEFNTCAWNQRTIVIDNGDYFEAIVKAAEYLLPLVNQETRASQIPVNSYGIVGSAFIDAYEYTGLPRYLNAAEHIAQNFVLDATDTYSLAWYHDQYLPGGVYGKIEGDIGAIFFSQLSFLFQLANATGDTNYRTIAQENLTNLLNNNWSVANYLDYVTGKSTEHSGHDSWRLAWAIDAMVRDESTAATNTAKLVADNITTYQSVIGAYPDDVSSGVYQPTVDTAWVTMVLHQLSSTDYSPEIATALALILDHRNTDGSFESDFFRTYGLGKTDVQSQAYVLMLLLEIDPDLGQYGTAVSDGMDWLISQQKTNGAWQFSSAWQQTTEHPQVVAEAMGALSRAATALGM